MEEGGGKNYPITLLRVTNEYEITIKNTKIIFYIYFFQNQLLIYVM